MAAVDAVKRRIITYSLAIAASWGLFRFLTPPDFSTEVLCKVPLEKVPAEGAYIPEGQKVALLRINGELTALSLICTHLGCTVTLTEENFFCPCHGSVFKHDGSVVNGPAGKPLEKHTISVENGIITVFTREA